MNRRRELHGDAHQPMLNTSYVYSWVSSYEQLVAILPSRQCEAVVDKYETRVAQYGYSLRNLRRVVPTKWLKDYLISLPEDDNAAL